jgi:ketosteroid isomerase-like protein
MNKETKILESANKLIYHFGSGDTDGYFSAFSPSATFILYNHPTRLMSLDEYRGCWRNWEIEFGFRVLSCQSSNQIVRMIGDTGLFMHDVRTETQTNAERSVLEERESILFRADPDGRWLAWHEHLSPAV